MKILNQPLLVLALGLACSLLPASCTKEQTLSPLETDCPTAKVYSEPDTELQKLYYEQLSQPEKDAIWIDHLNASLKTLELNLQQKSVIKETITLIETSRADDSNPEYIIVQSKASEVFSLKQVFLLFGSIGKIDPKEFFSNNALDTNSDVQHVNGGPIPKCGCSYEKGQDFCSVLSNKSEGIITYCNKTICERVPKDCGWLWKKDCMGNCLSTHVLLTPTAPGIF